MPQTSRDHGWNYGVFIANEIYRGQDILKMTLQNLATVITDRELLLKRLTSEEFNFDFGLCTGSELDEHTNVKDIGELVETFVENLRDEVNSKKGIGGDIDTLIVYFLGHGISLFGIDCLLGVDGFPYPVVLILQIVQSSRMAKKIVMVLDCCRNTVQLDQFREDQQARIKTALEEARKKTAFDKVVRIYSAQEGDTATDLKGATFAASLDKVLEGNPGGIRGKDLQNCLNSQWKKLQKEHSGMRGRVNYFCEVKYNNSEFNFP